MKLDAHVQSGRLPNPDAVVWARESTIATGPALGNRAVDVQVWGGVSFRAYPDRGLDLGQAWFGGVPLAWISEVGETGPLASLEGIDWGRAFGGGLLATCGLRNVGMPAEGHGLHGTYSHLSASRVTVERWIGDHDAGVEISGVVLDEGERQPLQHERKIRTYVGEGRVEIEDVTTNLGEESTAAPVLYHFNFGYPLWAERAELQMPVVATTPRDADSAVAVADWHLPPPLETAAERVLEHELAADDGWGWATVSNPEVGVAVTLRWDQETLPRLNQWLDPNPGMAVLGIEPANCSTRGIGFDRAAGRLPVLDPGEPRLTRLVVEAQLL